MNVTMEKKRICLDLDGVIAGFKKEGQTYLDVEPIPGAKEKIDALHEAGHYIILHTARHMKTCNGNLGQVNARISQITFRWLEKHQIHYDEIYFGKPWADIYIDDNAFRFETWDAINNDASNLPLNKEKMLK